MGKSLVNATKTILVLSCLFAISQFASAAVGDTLAIRAFYVENYSYGSLDADIGAGYALPPANFAWGKNKTTHTIMFGGSGNAGMFSQTSPYWGPVVSAADSASLISGNTGQPFWRWWRDSTHANGGYLIQSFNAVSSTDFDFVASDSARTETFWRAFIMWAIRNEVDGCDLDAESSNQSVANRTRFFRIGRRLGYNAAWQSYVISTGKPGFRRAGKMIIGNALFMLSTDWMSSSADSTIDFFDLQAYNYQNMWGGSSNRPWYQTPWGIPAGQACGTCQAQSLNYGYASHKNLVQEWVDAGWSRKKIVVGFDPGAVTVYTGTTAMGTGTPSGTETDWSRQDFEKLTSFGGTKTYNAVAMAPYISGTATGGGLSGPFVGSYTDSTSLKAICDELYRVGAGGIMVYAVAKDVATLGGGSNHALDYYRTPTISAGSYRAWQLNTATPLPPSAPTATTDAPSSITQTTATFNGSVSANGSSTTVRFVWGRVSGVYTDSALAAQSPIGSGSAGVSLGVTGLTALTNYYYRVRAYNALGNTQGNEVLCTTSAPPTAPTAITGAATLIGQSTATVNGTVNANGASTTVRFVYGANSGVYTDSVIATQSPIAAGSSSVSKGLTGLNTATTYYFRVRAYNSQGNVQGSEMSFATPAAGQGPQDITAEGSPIALIMAPTGEGNHNIEITRDGVVPPVGSTDVLKQYDTFTGGGPRSFDWSGFQFTSTRSFSSITYQEGLDNQWGGCFVSIQVQVRSGGVWANVQNLVSNPPYVSNNFVNYETFDLSFTQVAGDAIRIAGTPTGSAHYIGVGELRVFGTPSAATSSVVQGWNLVSNPVTASSDSVRALYPTSAFGYAYAFNPVGGYVQSYTLANGSGYWARFPSSTVVSFPGVQRTRDTVNVVAGWNMVGTISLPVDTATIVSIPAGLRTSPWVGYSSTGYTVATQLDPGRAYWVNSRSTGKFILSGSSSGRPATQQPTSGREVSDILNSLTITDSRGGSQTLYFGADARGEIPVTFYSMPPIPPVGAFDARFKTARGGSIVQTHTVEGSGLVEFPVTIQSDAYPVTVSWNVKNSSYELTDGNGNQVFSPKAMNGEGSFRIANSNVNTISVRLMGGTQLPTEFTLSQNYPNPFNPTTTIKYDLPRDARVILTVFNILGQEIATLVNDGQKAGYRSVEWNAANVPSGVYFYRLQAGDFVQTRKLLLLK